MAQPFKKAFHGGVFDKDGLDLEGTARKMLDEVWGGGGRRQIWD